MLIAIRPFWFQSLAGFLARCDIPQDHPFYPIFLVSIPGGFSGSLRRSGGLKVADVPVKFQSLAGFLARCDGLVVPDEPLDLGVSIPGGFSGSLRRPEP